MHSAGTSKLWITFFMGIIFSVLGLAGSLFSFGVQLDAITIIPGFLYSALVTKIALIVAGLLLLYDSFSVRDWSGRVRATSIIAGLVLAFIGAFPLLLDYGLLSGLPFIVNLTIPDMVLSILLTFYGIWLIIYFFKLYGVYKMHSTL